MYYRYQRHYTGPVEAVVFDWAGTLVDYGSLAPVEAFCRLFEQAGIPIDTAEARSPMGVDKRSHIARLLAMPRIRDAWTALRGATPTEDDIDRLYQAFVPLQIDTITQRAQLIPGALPTLHYLESRGIGVGSNTGYSRDMIGGLLEQAAEQGLRPHSVVCASDVQRGRPSPQMTLKNLLDLDVHNLHACIKIDDTVPGIEEGLNAGIWTVAVALSGNAVGLSLADWNALQSEPRRSLRERAYAQLNRSGAHYVIDSVADLPQVIEDIELRLTNGDRP